MSISASQIVKITPRVINAGSSELETVGMYLTTNPLCPYPKTLTFESKASVGAYFGYASKEYAQASKYFLGYDNSFRKPHKVTFGRYVPSAIHGTMIGTGKVATITEFQTVTNGKLVLKIDGARTAAVSLDFSSVTTPSGVCAILKNKFAGLATDENLGCVFNTDLNAFIFSSGTTGPTSSVAVMADDGGITIVNRYDLTQTKVTDGYSVDAEGLKQTVSETTTLVANWATVQASWNTYESYFEVKSTGSVYKYTWEGQAEQMCYGEPQQPSSVVNITEMLGLGSATSWIGATLKTPSTNMNEIIEYDQNWVSFTTLEPVADSVVVQFAQWANDADCEYLYCPYTTNEADINPNASTSLTKTLAFGNYESVILTFGNVDYATFVMSIGACIDWERVNGLVTYAFKQQSGLEATIDSNVLAEQAKKLNVNFYGSYATRNDQFVWYYQGKMIGGKFGFVDSFIGQLWLRNVIQVSIMNGLGLSGRIPYNDEGYTVIRAFCMTPIDRALNNGVIKAGMALSETQKATIMTETGDSGAPDEIFLKGYYLQVSDPSASVRAERGTPVLGLWYSDAGSIHRIELPVTAVQ